MRLLIGAALFVVSDRVVEARFGGAKGSGPAPYAFDRGGSWAGVWTVVGFAASLAST